MKAYKPKDGFDWNPALGFPRNEPCFCGSGKKFKKCHLLQMPRAVTHQDRATLQSYLRAKAEQVSAKKDP